VRSAKNYPKSWKLCGTFVVDAPINGGVAMGRDRFQFEAQHPAVAKQAEQQCKIAEIGQALALAGIQTLDKQAEALGLRRSTTWTILRAAHKNSGLSARIIKKMLVSPALPPTARARILEYAQEKASGQYGHKEARRRRFSAQLCDATSAYQAANVDRVHAVFTGRDIPHMENWISDE
jgi:hypothetical protein